MPDSINAMPVPHLTRHFMIEVAAPVVSILGSQAVNSLELQYFTPETNVQPNEKDCHAIEVHFVHDAIRPMFRVTALDPDGLVAPLRDKLTQIVEKLQVGDTSL